MIKTILLGLLVLSAGLFAFALLNIGDVAGQEPEAAPTISPTPSTFYIGNTDGQEFTLDVSQLVGACILVLIGDANDRLRFSKDRITWVSYLQYTPCPSEDVVFYARGHSAGADKIYTEERQNGPRLFRYYNTTVKAGNPPPTPTPTPTPVPPTPTPTPVPPTPTPTPVPPTPTPTPVPPTPTPTPCPGVCPLTAPAGLAVVGNIDSATVTWNAYSGIDITGYQYRYDSGGGYTGWADATSAQAAARAITIAGLVPGSTITIEIRALAGGETGPAGTITAVLPSPVLPTLTPTPTPTPRPW